MDEVYQNGKSKHKRINISVPSGLHEQMREHPQVNWSAVAAEAFRKTLLAIKGEAYTSPEDLEGRVARIEKLLNLA